MTALFHSKMQSHQRMRLFTGAVAVAALLALPWVGLHAQQTQPTISGAQEEDQSPAGRPDDGIGGATSDESGTSSEGNVIEFEPRADPSLFQDQTAPEGSSSDVPQNAAGAPDQPPAQSDQPVEIETLDLLPPPDDSPEAETKKEEAGRVPVSATLRALEKITAKTTDLHVDVGDTVNFKRLSIKLDTCDKRPPEDPPEVTAFLEIKEHTLAGDIKPLFTGWMFASSPGLSALENPVYDVWVIDCKMREPEQTAGSE